MTEIKNFTKTSAVKLKSFQKLITVFAYSYGYHKVKIRLGIELGLVFFEHLCDNNAHHKLAYNKGNKLNNGARNYKNSRQLRVMVYLADLRC